MVPPKSAFSPIYIPILNIPKSGIRLRPEFSAVCAHAGIQASSLLTLDDLSSDASRSENLRWILVDHNKLQGSLGARFSTDIIGVIDHHEEEHAIPTQTAPEPRIIEKSGSCTSLVVRYFRLAWDALSSSSLSTGAAHGQGETALNDTAYTQAWDAQVAKLALASILIDTANLTAPGKVTPTDSDAVAYLEAKIQTSPRDAAAWSRPSFYAEIQRAKSDIDNLTLHEVLRKDYKQWTETGDVNLGISSVVKPLDFLVAKANATSTNTTLATALDDFMASKHLTLFAIMTAFTSPRGDFRRQILLQARPGAHDLGRKFADVATAELGLRQSGDGEGIQRATGPAGEGEMWRDWWWQGEVGKSRKEVAPLLRRVMRG